MFAEWIKHHIPSWLRPFAKFIYHTVFLKLRNALPLLHDYCLRNLPLQKNKLVFISFLGTAYADNPKYISEEILSQKLPWDIVWFVKDLTVSLPSSVRPVLYGSKKAIYELATAKVVISNTRDHMRIQKKRGQIFLQTWHGGLGFKLVEHAAEQAIGSYYLASAKRDGQECDAIISSCAIQTEDYKQNFWLNPETNILEIGQPRCDVLFSSNRSAITQRVRSFFGFSSDTCMILYAPTFRDDGTTTGYMLDFDAVLNAFEATFHRPCALVLRLHPNAHNLCSFIQYTSKIVNGSVYPDVQELCIASDALITDYSSIAFDFALLEKPVFLCALDYAAYSNTRGITEWYGKSPFPKSQSFADLIHSIHTFSQNDYLENLHNFKETLWHPFDDGHAAKRAVDWIKQQIR